MSLSFAFSEGNTIVESLNETRGGKEGKKFYWYFIRKHLKEHGEELLEGLLIFIQRKQLSVCRRKDLKWFWDKILEIWVFDSDVVFNINFLKAASLQIISKAQGSCVLFEGKESEVYTSIPEFTNSSMWFSNLQDLN